MRAFATVIIILACHLAAAAQQPAPPKAKPAVSANAAVTDPDTEAMRADLAHMRVIVTQMQRNLAFVDSGLTPLKHQFELEIDMWNLLISDMQRRLNARTAAKPPYAAQTPAPQ